MHLVPVRPVTVRHGRRSRPHRERESERHTETNPLPLLLLLLHARRGSSSILMTDSSAVANACRLTSASSDPYMAYTSQSKDSKQNTGQTRYIRLCHVICLWGSSLPSTVKQTRSRRHSFSPLSLSVVASPQRLARRSRTIWNPWMPHRQRWSLTG